MTESPVPAPLRWAVVLLAAEAVAAGAAAGLLGYAGFGVEPAVRGEAFAVAGFVAVLAVALAGLAAALWRRKPRARAPAIVLQLLGVMFAIVSGIGGAILLAAAVAAPGIAVTTLLLTPRVSATMTATAGQ